MTDAPKYCKIGEAAEYMYVSSQALRNWERQGLLVPDIVKETGHRKYRWDAVVNFRKQYERKPIPEGVSLMTSGDVCNFLHIGTTLLRRLVSQGYLTPALVLPPTNRMLFIPADVDAYVASGKGGSLKRGRRKTKVEASDTVS